MLPRTLYFASENFSWINFIRRAEQIAQAAIIGKRSGTSQKSPDTVMASGEFV